MGKNYSLLSVVLIFLSCALFDSSQNNPVPDEKDPRFLKTKWNYYNTDSTEFDFWTFQKSQYYDFYNFEIFQKMIDSLHPWSMECYSWGTKNKCSLYVQIRWYYYVGPGIDITYHYYVRWFNYSFTGNKCNLNGRLYELDTVDYSEKDKRLSHIWNAYGNDSTIIDRWIFGDEEWSNKLIYKQLNDSLHGVNSANYFWHTKNQCSLYIFTDIKIPVVGKDTTLKWRKFQRTFSYSVNGSALKVGDSFFTLWQKLQSVE